VSANGSDGSNGSNESNKKDIYGAAWTYESIIGAFPIPGIDLTEHALAPIQFAIFEVGVVLFALLTDNWGALLPGSAAVLVATGGSVLMTRIAEDVRSRELPDTYRRLLFGANIETVLAVLAFISTVIYLFSYDPRQVPPGLLTELLGPRPGMVVLFFTLLLLWDVCYRIAAGWWIAATSLWRSWRYEFDADMARTLRRADAATAAFGLLQLVLVPFVWGHDEVVASLLVHAAALAVFTGGSALWLTRQIRTNSDARQSVGLD
jgi:hypothetical protein